MSSVEQSIGEHLFNLRHPMENPKLFRESLTFGLLVIMFVATLLTLTYAGNTNALGISLIVFVMVLGSVNILMYLFVSGKGAAARYRELEEARKNRLTQAQQKPSAPEVGESNSSKGGWW
jgi:hypothetical protein